MTKRRFTTSGLALVAALSLGVAGCSQPAADSPAAPTGEATTASQLSALEELQAAVEKLNQESVRVSLTGGAQSGGGEMDPRAGTAKMNLKMSLGGESMDIEFIRLQDDIYLKVPGLGGGAAGKWMHIDGSKLAADSSLGNMLRGDPAGAENLIKGVAEVQRDGERRFKGTIDVTKSPTANSAALGTLGDKAKAVPFTAAVDEQGRLTELTVDMSVLAAALGKLVATYSDFGAPVTVERPAASEVTEAPAELLGAFNA